MSLRFLRARDRRTRRTWVLITSDLRRHARPSVMLMTTLSFGADLVAVHAFGIGFQG